MYCHYFWLSFSRSISYALYTLVTKSNVGSTFWWQKVARVEPLLTWILVTWWRWTIPSDVITILWQQWLTVCDAVVAAASTIIVAAAVRRRVAQVAIWYLHSSSNRHYIDLMIISWTFDFVISQYTLATKSNSTCSILSLKLNMFNIRWTKSRTSVHTSDKVELDTFDFVDKVERV